MSINDARPEDWDAATKSYIQAIEDTLDSSTKDSLKAISKKYNEKQDVVNKPAHYNQGGIECIEYIQQVTGDGFAAYCQGNVTKYLHRWQYKNGLEDLKKAQWYLNKMVEAVDK